MAAYALSGTIWGAHHLRFLPAGGVAAWFVLIALIASPPGRALLSGVADAASRLATEHRRLAVLAGALFASALFILFRSRNHFTGDGLLVASIVSDPSQSGSDRAGFFVIVLHKIVLALLRAPFPQANGLWAFALVSVITGLGVLWLASLVARDLFPAARSRALAFAALAASGGIALFFGHVEEYPVLQLAILAYVALAVRSLCGRVAIVYPTLVLIAVFLAHPLGAFLAPSWIVLAIGGRRDSRPRSRRDLFLSIGLLLAGGVVLVARASFVARSTYGGASAFVPLFDPNAQSAFTLFLPAHFAFLANEMLLILGGALLLPILRLPANPSPPDEEAVACRTIRLFLTAASAGLLLAVFVIDPKFGGRDWDLMALPLFPVILLLAHIALAKRAEPSRVAVLLVVAAMVLHTLPWIWINTNRDRSVAMLLAVVANDPHYMRTGQSASRFLGRVLSEAGYRDEMGRMLELAARYAQDEVDFRNLGTYLAQSGRDEEARPWLLRALESHPDNGETLKQLAIVHLRLGRTAEAVRFFQSWLAVEPDNPEANVLLGTVLAEIGDVPTGLRLCERAIELDATNPDVWYMFGLVLRKAERHEESERAFAREAELKSSPKRPTE